MAASTNQRRRIQHDVPHNTRGSKYKLLRLLDQTGFHNDGVGIVERVSDGKKLVAKRWTLESAMRT